jgi:hypothetical protein
MSTQVTAVLSDSAMPKMKKIRNPGVNPPKITEDMEYLATLLIRSPIDTDDFIQEIEEGCSFCEEVSVLLIDGQCYNCTLLDEHVGDGEY